MARPRTSLQREARTEDADSDIFDDRNAVNDVEIPQSPLFDDLTFSRRQSVVSQTSHHTADAAPAQQPSTSNFGTRRELRNSIRKSRSYLENPFSSEADQYATGPSNDSLMASRATTDDLYNDSDADDGEFAETNSTFQSGSSQEYSQFSHATPLTPSSTAPSTNLAPTSSRQSLHGPAHPYNMYPQNVDDIDDSVSQADEHTPTQRIPVGFPRTTPLIRLDVESISEQLPPYSEYPEDGAPRHIAVPPRIAEVAPSTSASSLHTVISIARQPQSMSDHPDTSETHSMLEESSTNYSSEIGLLSNQKKTWAQKSWREKRKTKFWGIPFGWIVLVLGVLFFIAVVLSSVIGGFFTAQARLRQKFNAQTLFDAEQLFNASTTPLTPGRYQLDLGPAQEIENECITNSSQVASWSCNILSPMDMQIVISNPGPSTGPSTQMASVIKSGNPGIGYGTEIPHTLPSLLRLVKDMDLPQFGPAWEFQAIYTKTVIAWPDAFYPAFVGANGLPAPPPPPAAPAQNQKRDWVPMTQAGQQPWFCYWNNTLLEGFIYVDQNATGWYSNASTQGLSQQRYNQAQGPRVINREEMNPAEDVPMPTPVLSSAVSKSSTATIAPTASWTGQPFYPQVIKIEERRIPGTTSQPYCQKMLIRPDGSPAPILDQNGFPYRIEIDEVNPKMSAYASAYGPGVKKAKRTLVSGGCHCQWMSGETS